jgi:hypothetical protein
MVAAVVERVEEAGGDAPRLGDLDFVIRSCEGRLKERGGNERVKENEKREK